MKKSATDPALIYTEMYIMYNWVHINHNKTVDNVSMVKNVL